MSVLLPRSLNLYDFIAMIFKIFPYQSLIKSMTMCIQTLVKEMHDESHYFCDVNNCLMAIGLTI